MTAGLALLVAGGALAGILAGLLGIGGGLLLVPLLAAVLVKQGLTSAAAMPLAVGTSLATIVFTGTAAALAHRRRGALDQDWPGPVSAAALGGLLGAFLAHHLGGAALKGLFAAFETLVGLRFLLAAGPREDARPAPAGRRLLLPATLTGLLSALLGVGGGTLSVPWLTALGLRLHRALALSSAMGVGIALAGAGGFALAGAGVGGRPPASLGYLWLPAVAAVVPASMAGAPLGAHLAHRLPVRVLRRLFGALLVFTGLAMALS